MASDKITIEDSRFSPHVIDKLEEYGHDIGIKRSIGEANCIMYDKKLNLFMESVMIEEMDKP